MATALEVPTRPLPSTGETQRSLSAYGPARSTVQGAPLDAETLQKMDAYWRACNYLSLGMIYLQDNPLLREPLKPEHIKNRRGGPSRIQLENLPRTDLQHLSRNHNSCCAPIWASEAKVPRCALKSPSA